MSAHDTLDAMLGAWDIQSRKAYPPAMFTVGTRYSAPVHVDPTPAPAPGDAFERKLWRDVYTARVERYGDAWGAWHAACNAVFHYREAFGIADSVPAPAPVVDADEEVRAFLPWRPPVRRGVKCGRVNCDHCHGCLTTGTCVDFIPWVPYVESAARAVREALPASIAASTTIEADGTVRVDAKLYNDDFDRAWRAGQAAHDGEFTLRDAEFVRTGTASEWSSGRRTSTPCNGACDTCNVSNRVACATYRKQATR